MREDISCTTHDIDFKQNKTVCSECGKEFFFYVPPVLVVVMLLFSPLEPDIKNKTQDTTLNDAFLALQNCAQIPLCGDLIQRQTTRN